MSNIIIMYQLINMCPLHVHVPPTCVPPPPLLCTLLPWNQLFIYLSSQYGFRQKDWFIKPQYTMSRTQTAQAPKSLSNNLTTLQTEITAQAGIARLGHGMSRARHVQGTACPGHGMSRARHVQGMACPGHGMSRAWHVQGTACPLEYAII